MSDMLYAQVHSDRIMIDMLYAQVHSKSLRRYSRMFGH